MKVLDLGLVKRSSICLFGVFAITLSGQSVNGQVPLYVSVVNLKTGKNMNIYSTKPIQLSVSNGDAYRISAYSLKTKNSRVE